MKAVHAHAAQHKIKLGAAVKAVAAQHPDLHASYVNSCQRGSPRPTSNNFSRVSG